MLSKKLLGLGWVGLSLVGGWLVWVGFWCWVAWVGQVVWWLVGWVDVLVKSKVPFERANRYYQAGPNGSPYVYVEYWVELVVLCMLLEYGMKKDFENKLVIPALVIINDSADLQEAVVSSYALGGVDGVMGITSNLSCLCL